MTTTQSSPRRKAQEVRARYLVPLFVLTAMLGSTLGAVWIFRLNIHPALDGFVHGISSATFLVMGVIISFGVFYVLLRYATAREDYIHQLAVVEKQLEAANELAAHRNEGLQSTTAQQSAELNEKLELLEKSRTAMVSLLEDLTQSRDEVESARAFDEAVLANLGEGVLVFDVKGTVTLMNEAAHRIAGLSGTPADYIGRNGYDLFTVIDQAGEPVPRGIGPVARILAAGGKAAREVELNYRLKQPGGQIIDIEYQASPIIRAGALIAVVILVRDTTEQKRIDRAKSEFVSLASHQLRTPLTAIGWYAELLEGEASGKFSEQEKEYIHEIYQANRRMINLVDSLLNVSRIEMGQIDVQPELLDLSEFMRNEIGVFAPLVAAKNITIESDLVSQAPQYAADPKLTAIIVQNLLSNAVKYSFRSSVIRVVLAYTNGIFSLSVSDKGIGIPKIAQGRMYNKLFRADNAQIAEAEGSGLGLYLVKSIIDQIGGSIRFDSVEGQGTTFTVDFPAGGMAVHHGAKTVPSEPQA